MLPLARCLTPSLFQGRSPVGVCGLGSQPKGHYRRNPLI